MFYKNGDAFCDVGWDDNLVLNADPTTSVPVSPLIQVYYTASRRKVSVNSQRLTGPACWPFSIVITQLFTQGENLQGKALQDFVIDKIDDLKGQDIIALDVQGKSSITDCMIICTGTSSRHVMSIADHVVQSSRAAGMLPLGVEGENAADWIVVDLGDVIVHVMQEESRRLYELEKLWS